MKKILALLMSCMVISISCGTSTSSLAMMDAEYATGITQGKLDGGSGVSIGWSSVGFLFGPFGVLAGGIAPGGSPSSDIGLIFGEKTDEYKLGYGQGYREGSQSKNLRSSLIGWALWIPIGLALYAGE